MRRPFCHRDWYIRIYTCTHIHTYIYSYVVVITNNSTLNGNDAFSHEMCFYKRINRQYDRHHEHLELAIYSSS